MAIKQKGKERTTALGGETPGQGTGGQKKHLDAEVAEPSAQQAEASQPEEPQTGDKSQDKIANPQKKKAAGKKDAPPQSSIAPADAEPPKKGSHNAGKDLSDDVGPLNQNQQDDQNGAADEAGPDAASLDHDHQDDPATADGQPSNELKKKKKKKVLSKEKVEKLREKAERRGIIYISRIPPHMKPMKLKQLLSQYGEIGRVYCAPEDPSARKLRKKKGGNTGKNFTEGWIEFEDKRVAKRVAAALNGTPMGGKHRSAYRFDLWCLKYLPKFKWDHLTEEINYARAVREQRLAAEISAAKKERDFYLSRVDKAKAIRAIKERKEKKAAAEGQGQGSEPAGAPGPLAPSAAPEPGQAGAGGGVKRPRHVFQRRAAADPAKPDSAAPELARDVLMMVGHKKARTEAA